MRRVVCIVILLLATTHCVMSIFYLNTSWINLHDYAHGVEKLPFQGRLLMAPVVRWGEEASIMHKLALRYSHSVPQLEPMSGAKLTCLLVGVVCVNLLGITLSLYSARLKLRFWWIGWALLIAILYASYGARYEQALWYPYDLPHMLAFGVATIGLLIDQPLLFISFFLLDVSIRETAIFLLPIAAVLHYRSVLWRWLMAAGLVAWALSRTAVHFLYPHNAVVRNPPHDSVRYLLPWHLPQFFSIVGFLWIPVLMGRRYLSSQYRLALYAISGIMIFTFYFAVWNESRVWLEWTTAFAIFAALELQSILSGDDRRHETMEEITAPEALIPSSAASCRGNRLLCFANHQLTA